jgi:hypothetical protein
LKVAIDSFKGTLSFVQADLPRRLLRSGRQASNRVQKSTKTAAEAIARYIKHLQGTKPDPQAVFAIGKENYEAKLKYEKASRFPSIRF